MNTVKEKELQEFFERGVTDFIDTGSDFKKKLEAKIAGKYKKDIVVKIGVDPTRPDIHLGHAVVLRKLRQLQDWGCKVVFLVGDFTAQIGDPTGKDKTRPEVEQKEIEKNLKTYLEQVGKILRTDKEVFSWIRNSDWFTSITDLNLPENYKVNLEIKHSGKDLKLNIPPNSFVGKAIVFEKSRMQVTSLALKNKITSITLRTFLWSLKHITFSRLIERDMFQERMKKGFELRMHEVMYPVLQGIDSQAISQIYGSCDLEVGGSDQLFNMLVGRDVLKFNKKEPQAVLVFELLLGLEGKEKMSKSLDNYVGIAEAPDQMFGKIMSIPDTRIVDYFTLATYHPTDEIKKIKTSLGKESTNPRDIKLNLAEQIVLIYHGEKEAAKAKEKFLKVFQKKEIPEDIESVLVEKNQILSEILLSQNVVQSKTEFRRLVDEGAIQNLTDKEKVKDPNAVVSKNSVFKIGKKRFLEIKIK